MTDAMGESFCPVVDCFRSSTKMRDGRELGAPGDVEEWDGPVVLCESGLHASERILDALSYAPGALLRRVEIAGQCKRGEDKLAGQRGRILWECDKDIENRTWPTRFRGRFAIHAGKGTSMLKDERHW